MSDKIQCPGCDSSWVLDEIGGGGEFICPSCLNRIQLPETVAVGAAEKVEGAPVSARASAGAAKSIQSVPATAPEASPPPADEEPRVDEEVVCPRCQLHFYPRGKHVAQTRRSRHTVLVVEDQEYFREIASDALESSYEVKTAGSTAEAREILAAGGIDLLVLDLTLGGGDEGEQLLRELVPKPCPILIFTAQDESELYGERWEELSQCGADDLVMKGMQVDESLRRKAGALLGQPVDDDE